MKSPIALIIIYLLNAASYVVPKRDDQVAFIPIHDKKSLSGNMLPVYTRILQEGGLHSSLISNSEKAREQAKSLGGITYHWGLRAVWAILRARILVLDAEKYTLVGNFTIVQLWHGTGYKRIGAEVPQNLRKYWPWQPEQYNYSVVLANSPADQERKSHSFPGATPIITGSPKNDELLCYKSELNIPSSLRDFISESKKVYLYAPTFRDTDDPEARTLTQEFWKAINKQLANTNSCMVVRRHPYSGPATNLLPAHDRIFDATTLAIDTVQILRSSDVLITDYSGIATDFALLQRPIIFFAYDWETYREKCREFYYDLERIVPGPFLERTDELIWRVGQTPDDMLHEFSDAYQRFLSMMHTHIDDQSTKRACQVILSIL